MTILVRVCQFVCGVVVLLGVASSSQGICLDECWLNEPCNPKGGLPSCSNGTLACADRTGSIVVDGRWVENYQPFQEKGVTPMDSQQLTCYTEYGCTQTAEGCVVDENKMKGPVPKEFKPCRFCGPNDS